MDRESIRVYLDLLDLEPSQRRPELHRRCAGQPKLIAAVESLLDHETVAGAGGSPMILPPTDPGPDAVEQSDLVETIPDAPGPVDAYPPGTPIGPYRIGRIIAPGGMGVVYLAREEGIRRTVALKVIRGPVSERARRRFLVERQALADLVHPNIVTLYAAGTTERGEPYFAMQYVDGSTLNDRPREPLATPRECARILLPVVDAVAYAHDQGVIHRDLKPANILVDGAGRPMVADFGLAHSVRDPRPRTETQVGRLSGTPGYMAPEQIAGGPGCRSEPVDVYALGGLLYFLLTGHDPHEGGSPLEICTRALREPPTPIRHFRRDVPRDLITLVEKAMEPAPARRLSSARVLADDLRLFLEGKPINTRPTSRTERVGRWVWGHRVGVAAVVSPVLAVLVGSLLVLAGKNRELSATNRKLGEAVQEASGSTSLLVRLINGNAEDVEKAANRLGTSDPRFDELAAGFVERIDRVVAQWKGSPVPIDLAYRRALAHFQVARSLAHHLQMKSAYQHYQVAVDALRPLARDHLERADIRYDLFRTLCCYGDQESLSDPELCISLHRESLEVIRSLAGDFPAELDYRDAEASETKSLGDCLMTFGRRAEGEGLLRQAAAIAEELVSTPGARGRYRRHVAMALGKLAEHFHLEGKIEVAEVECRRSIEAGALLLRDLPDDTELRDEHAFRLQLLARIRGDRGDFNAARSLLDEAVSIRDDLVVRRPRALDYQERAALAHMERLAVDRVRGRTDEAPKDIAAYERLLKLGSEIRSRGEHGVWSVVGQSAILGTDEAIRIAPLAATLSSARLVDDPWARVTLVRAYLARGDCRKALDLVTTDLPEDQRRFAAFHYLAAIAEARLGHPEAARARLAVDPETLGGVHGNCLLVRCLRQEAEQVVKAVGG